MEAYKADLSDKENVAPKTSGWLKWPELPDLATLASPEYPELGRLAQQRTLPPLPPQPPKYDAKTHANIARKRQRLAALTETPPRPSHASQMSSIFAKSAPSRAYHRPMSFATPDHPKTGHAYRPKPLARTDRKTSRPGTHSPAPTHPHSPGSVSSSSADSPDKHPLDDLERAVAMSFSSTPSREERRKTLNIERSPRHEEPSTDEWTGDDIFFRRSPREREDSIVRKPAPQNISLPIRNDAVQQRATLRSSRFFVQGPPSRSRFGSPSPVALSRPASASDDADDEATESEVET